MMKSFLLFLFFIKNVNSLNTTEYIASIVELSLDEKFLIEYAKWSFKLFSQPDYMYGVKTNPFPCQIPPSSFRNEPTSVHTLRPSDIKCVGAVGDSLTAGLGAHAATPIGLFTENRGSSWSIGGDYTFDDLISLPNILREYNPNLKGYSTKSSVIFLAGQNSSHNGLNVAKSGDTSHEIMAQVPILHERLASNDFCDMENDWKIITLFVGGNDLCIFCQDLDLYTPENYLKNVIGTLDYLQANFPRTFVNLVLVLDVRNVKDLNEGGFVCQTLHGRTCPCAAFPTADDSRTLTEWIQLYHQYLLDLVNSGKYDTKEDFTVVVQPFMAHTKLPRMMDGDIDYSYFAPDCFHFSGKGHARAALSLWNNMLEPVGEKKWEWYTGENLECPTEERPYFATRLNSPQSIEKIPPLKKN